MWGVHPDQSRNRIIFTGNGEKGVAVPIADWGLEFSENMPDAIREAILKARGESAGTVENQEYRKRLQDKFGSRWHSTQLVHRQQKLENEERVNATLTNETAQVVERREREGVSQPHKRKRRRRIHLVQLRAMAGGHGEGVEREVAVDVPRYRYTGKDAFEDPWHLASWVPMDPEGPTVLMNQDSPILLEAIKYHQGQYPEIFVQDVEEIVKSTYGEVAVCKIAHSQKLAKYVSEQELDDTYRSDSALTIEIGRASCRERV